MINMFEKPTYKPQTVRPYQMAGVEAIEGAWSRGEERPIRALLACATGGGKTTILSELLRRNCNPHHHRAVVIAHTEEIITQIRERIANQYGGALDATYGVRYAKGIGVVMAEQDDFDARIVVATRQSLHPKRLEKLLLAGAPDFIIIDEAHHAAPGTTYMDIIGEITRHNPAVKVAGFTATPKRTDELALGAVWDEIVYEWLIEDGIKAGFLVPPVRKSVTTHVSLSRVESSHGDYTTSKLVKELEGNHWTKISTRAYMEHIQPTGRLAIAFFPSVEMSQEFTKALKAEGVAAEHLDGETPKEERRHILNAYKVGKLRLISNCAVLTEGFDAPETGAILMARPTRSSTLYTQIIGRGLRPFPGKDHCLIVELSVTDVKALQRGDLIGRMTRCRGCGNEHYAGLKACPVCGFVRPPKERARDGAEVEAWEQEELDLFSVEETVFIKAFAAWYSGGDGFYSCQLSFEEGSLLIIPPETDEFYRLLLIPKKANAPLKVLDHNEDLAALMLAADTTVKRSGGANVSRQAAWRDKQVSIGQLSFMESLGIPYDEKLSTQGAAAQIITHTMAMNRLKRGAK